MNSDLLSYVIPILGSSLSVILSVYSLFSAKKLYKGISQAALSIKKAKQLKHDTKRKKIQDRLTKLYLREKKIEQLQLNLEEMNKLILRYEELAKQESELKQLETDHQQVVLLKQISDLLEKSAIPKIESIGTSDVNHN